MSNVSTGSSFKFAGSNMASIVIDYDVDIPLRDGVILRGDIARPAAGKLPAIVIQTPYGKTSAALEPVRYVEMLARKGFAALIVDTRGRNNSDGSEEFLPFTGHEADGADVVEWLAKQEWCNGDIFGFGPSYHGSTQWATAVARPPALRAIAPGNAPGLPTRSMFYSDGMFELSLAAAWWMMMGADSLMRRHADDPAALGQAMSKYGEAFTGMLSDNYTELPIYAPFDRAGWGDSFKEIILSERGHGHPTLDALAAIQEYERITVPAIIWGGWYDVFSRATVDQYVGMRKRAGSKAARENTRLIIGPWVHSVDQASIVGERDFGGAAASIALQPNALFDEILGYFKDIASGTPQNNHRVKIFVMGANAWRDEEDWPIARAQTVPMYLSSGGNAHGAPGDGRLTNESGSSPADAYIYDPADPVPTTGGNSLSSGLAGPRDQRRVEERSDVLVYTSEPLAEGIEVTGTVKVELWIETDVVDTDFVLKLVDVAPDGSAYQVAEGGLRARWRNDPEMNTEGAPLVPGKATLIEIELTPTSNLFLPGHSIRLDVTSSNFPRWARNLNIWDQKNATLADSRIAHQKVLHDADHPSRVLLPVIPASTAT